MPPDALNSLPNVHEVRESATDVTKPEVDKAKRDAFINAVDQKRDANEFSLMQRQELRKIVTGLKVRSSDVAEKAKLDQVHAKLEDTAVEKAADAAGTTAVAAVDLAKNGVDATTKVATDIFKSIDTSKPGGQLIMAVASITGIYAAYKLYKSIQKRASEKGGYWKLFKSSLLYGGLAVGGLLGLGALNKGMAAPPATPPAGPAPGPLGPAKTLDKLAGIDLVDKTEKTEIDGKEYEVTIQKDGMFIVNGKKYKLEGRPPANVATFKVLEAKVQRSGGIDFKVEGSMFMLRKTESMSLDQNRTKEIIKDLASDKAPSPFEVTVNGTKYQIELKKV